MTPRGPSVLQALSRPPRKIPHAAGGVDEIAYLLDGVIDRRLVDVPLGARGPDQGHGRISCQRKAVPQRRRQHAALRCFKYVGRCTLQLGQKGLTEKAALPAFVLVAIEVVLDGAFSRDLPANWAIRGVHPEKRRACFRIRQGVAEGLEIGQLDEVLRFGLIRRHTVKIR